MLARAPRPGRGPPAPLAESRRVSRAIALAVAVAARREGLAAAHPGDEPERLIDAKMWEPRYLPMRLKRS